MLELLQQLTPIYGPLSALLIVAVVVMYIDNRRLREERNKVVDRKDLDLKEANVQVVDLHKETLTTIAKFGQEAEVRAVKDEAKTDAIVETLKGIQQVLISTHK